MNKIITTSMKDLYILNRCPIEDERGYFERLYCSSQFEGYFPGRKIEQINHTLTKKCHSVRGMHFQKKPFSEIKIVSCVKGAVYDVAVDVRKDSPTFLQSYGEILTDKNHKSLIIPEGFAHGFQTLSDDCELVYMHTTSYQPSSEGCINPRDPKLSIDWPHEITCISERDSNQCFIKNNYEGIVL